MTSGQSRIKRHQRSCWVAGARRTTIAKDAPPPVGADREWMPGWLDIDLDIGCLEGDGASDD
jgi:hypothetical protein